MDGDDDSGYFLWHFLWLLLEKVETLYPFLGASSHLNKRGRRSVGPSVRPSTTSSVRPQFFFYMKVKDFLHGNHWVGILC